jgi:nucleotide-binding universal stress UspA family protein
LCPIDFSDASARAVEHAIALAGWYRARITALHVYTPLFAPIPGLPRPVDRVSDAELQRARCDTENAFRAAAGAAVEVDVVVDVGQAAAQILRRARDGAADLIVLGTHGASGFERLVLGSVAEKVLRRATCPVVTVPPRTHDASRLPYERLLCAIDFSDWSLEALQHACALARDAKAALTVLHVIEWPWEEPPAPSISDLPPEQALALGEYRRYCEVGAMTRLESLVTDPDAVTGPVALRIAHGKPYAQILRVAGEAQADLIVIGVHGRTPLDLGLLGSTANQVVRRAQCPVLTLRR